MLFRSRTVFCVLLYLLITACGTNRYVRQGTLKIPPDQLQKDFKVLREILEEMHPSLYWYTPREKMDSIFNFYQSRITDSLNETAFGFSVLSPVLSSIRCGHTSLRYSKDFTELLEGAEFPSFPLFLKVWKDTMVVTRSLREKDSVFQQGTLIHSINGMQEQQLSQKMFRYFPSDGYSQTLNYIRLSTSFPTFHRNIFGLPGKYEVRYFNKDMELQTTLLEPFRPKIDTSLKAAHKKSHEQKRKKEKPKREDRLQEERSMYYDSLGRYAIMDLNSFENNLHLKSFFRKSFRELKKRGIKDLVIDIRNNGGGRIDLFTSLARYLKDSSFRVADSAFAIKGSLGSYRKYMKSSFGEGLVLTFLTRKKEDGLHHFRYWEKQEFKPRKKAHYNGNVYLLIGGPTFSAGSLFAHSMKGQSNVQLIGEETGGGWHGNNGILIPEITLPNSRMRVRLPLFRLVQYQHIPHTGQGVMPDILVQPTWEAVRLKKDLKMEKALEIIESAHQQ